MAYQVASSFDASFSAFSKLKLVSMNKPEKKNSWVQHLLLWRDRRRILHFHTHVEFFPIFTFIRVGYVQIFYTIILDHA